MSSACSLLQGGEEAAALAGLLQEALWSWQEPAAALQLQQALPPLQQEAAAAAAATTAQQQAATL
jgi:hypothetical protein